ncbi:MAG: DUF4294 domain-containing protein [Bacteroidaceae bacterium]|jgi:hypothetical protein|nr:DUF4294 domain-containing protein [Bacteroidaceae bacterium]SDF92890.1 protein of unknown function [Bacteroidales bacterium KHT7]MBQ4462666.1 DUF4294 domain-containing protein [Bacteroidaceae bacterium]MBQ4462667.1 DUF4294 domain-containing protein [Bacteroidaceae bacterium]MBQ7483716.1 DUF4294 domain-containing protein [Bacteroidaceae bacterium]
MREFIKNIVLIVFLSLCLPATAQSDKDKYDPGEPIAAPRIKIGKCLYRGDTIAYVELQNIYIYPKLVFKNDREMARYYKLVRNVKKTLPIAKQVNQTVKETYEILETLPNKKAKDAHIKRVEKGIKEQYTPQMKKLTYAQGKLLIKLVDRECNQPAYELIKAFMGPFKSGCYQAFASVFGASLKKEYKSETDDRLTERVVLLVENGQL